MGEARVRPKVEAILRYGENEFRTLMLIDSGADISFLPAVVAEILQLDLSEETHPSRGVTGWFETRLAKCDVWLIATSSVLELKNIPVFVPVEDCEEEEDSVMDYCLLGRKPLFDRFNVCFKQRKRRVVTTRSRYD